MVASRWATAVSNRLGLACAVGVVAHAINPMGPRTSSLVMARMAQFYQRKYAEPGCIRRPALTSRTGFQLR